jgi:hypothetical protein
VSQLKRDGSALSLALSLVTRGLITRDEMLALLEGMTLEEYRLSKTKLGKLLAGKDE